MKIRSIAWALLIATLLTTLLAALPVMAETEEGLTNVALGAKYESSAPYVLDADKHTNNYRNKDYDELTDGEKGSDPVGDEWYAFIGGQEYYITIDLGKTYDDLARIAVECCNKEDWGIVLPASIKASGSVDGKEYTDLGTFTDLNEGDTGAYHSYVLDISGEYRYIRIDLKKAGFFTFVSEVEVFSGYIGTLSINKGNAFIKDNTIHGLSEKTTVDAFSAVVNSMKGVSITDHKGNPKKDGYLATGDVVSKMSAEGEPTAYTVIIDGDLNYDGIVTSKDYMMLKRHALGTYELDVLCRPASDVNADGKTDAKDYMMLKRHVLGTFDIFKKYEPVPEKDGRGDVTDEFKDMDTTDNITELASYDMTIKRTAQTTYSITCKTEAGELLLTLYKTAWGTYNLGKWELTETGGKKQTFVSGSTDWEYVYRVAPSASASWVWSGGNHDNEQMRSLTFYDGKTNEAFELAVGESKAVTNLKVVEETSLFWGDAKNGYSEDEHYADAVRTYTIVGPQIKLAVDYTYVKDAYYYDASYTCMFPINKKYGLYCAFLDGEKLLHVAETFKVGDASYNGKFHGNAASDRCIMWGYDGMEKYKFDVRVLTPETSTNNFNNTMKVAFWDMNTGTNKLYFSKYGSPRQKVALGTEIHTECMWTFYIDN